DRRDPARPRPGARRHDPALPRARSARARLRAQAAHGFHHPPHRQDDARHVRLVVAAQMDRAVRRLRVLLLVHPDLVPPDSAKGYTKQEINEWKTEYDVAKTLRAAGHH